MQVSIRHSYLLSREEVIRAVWEYLSARGHLVPKVPENLVADEILELFWHGETEA
jgi:hypothetical protein